MTDSVSSTAAIAAGAASGILRVEPIPAFRDNYIWALIAGTRVAVVDPGEAAPVLAFLRQEKLELAAILLTHHHADHVGGVGELLALRAVPVFGPRTENIPLATH